MSGIVKKDQQLDTTGVDGELVKRLTDEDKKLALDVLKRLADEIRADLTELNDVPPSFLLNGRRSDFYTIEQMDEQLRRLK